ncbi:Pyruvate dehydrogenase protein X component [Acropora cervicornis]|uniref:Dihydrolipoamide acetyltransferase component of pyruvate dehydrogenase complex n=1 Tax=Acropora cervicornis TaxID=6130 RepID=A0AAD9R6L1_ACRCE|nr:Pyruvate dehydrogenase protein X component [Acropora cervicornis]
MAAQGWLRTMQVSMNYIWRTANIRGPSCIKAKVLCIQECRRTFITSIVRQAVPTTQILMPALSPTMEEGTIVKWVKKEGEAIAPGDMLCEIETDKATIAMDSDEEGILAKIIVPEGTKNVKVNQLIALMVEEGEDITQVEVPLDTDVVTNPAETTDHSSHSHTDPKESVLMSPAVRILLETYRLNPRLIPATGPKGRLLKGDVLRYVAQEGKPFTKPGEAEVTTKTAMPTTMPPLVTPLQPDKSETTEAKPVAPKPQSASRGTEYTDLPNSNMRRTIAKRLSESKANIPHTYASTNCVMDSLIQFRKGLSVKVSMNDFIIKAAAISLKQVPEMNVVWNGKEAELSGQVDISVAVATEAGLITPIVKTADSLAVAEISSTLKDLASRAREGKLKPQEFQGGSFTISNLGMYGITEFSAVINPPQACILAIGGTRLLFNADEKIQSIMTATLSCDRRMVDDELAARWLEAFKSNIEKPSRLLL